MKTILSGSRAFFEGIEGFVSKDTDYVMVYELEEADFDFYRFRHSNKDEFFQFVRYPKNILMGRFSKPQYLGHLIVPQVAIELGITLEDLSSKEHLIERLPKKYKYLSIIYHAFLHNGDFVLTDEQRKEAYKAYKSERNKYNQPSFV